MVCDQAVTPEIRLLLFLCLQSVCSTQTCRVFVQRKACRRLFNTKPAECLFSAKPAERSFSVKPAERLFNTKPAECSFSAKPEVCACLGVSMPTFQCPKACVCVCWLSVPILRRVLSVFDVRKRKARATPLGLPPCSQAVVGRTRSVGDIVRVQVEWSSGFSIG